MRTTWLCSALCLGLAAGSFAWTDDKVKQDVKIEGKDENGKYKEKSKIRDKGDKIHEDTKIKGKDAAGKYEEKTKVRGHGDDIKTETKVKEKD